MRFRKVYGQSKTEPCPFCGERAIAMNSQSIPVCVKHKNRKLPDMKCACGEWLDIRKGKWGPYFSCMNCGNISFSKALDMNPKLKEKENLQTDDEVKTDTGKQTSAKPAYKPVKETRKEVTITSDELDFYY